MEADEFSKNSSSTAISSSTTDVLSYTTHPKAIYESRLLDFRTKEC